MGPQQWDSLPMSLQTRHTGESHTEQDPCCDHESARDSESSLVNVPRTQPQERSLGRPHSWRSHHSLEEDSIEEESLPDSDEESQSSSQSSGKRVQQQQEMRKQIVLIQQDTTLSAAEKAKRVQELMTKQWTSKQQQEKVRDTRPVNRLSDKKHDFDTVTAEDRCVTYHAPGVYGCRHYQRACKLQAHCCGKWDTCRFCHDEVSDHTITRNLINTMMCMHCSTVQPAGQVCINADCGKKVAEYYCKECKLWDNDPKKTIYHCYDCGICRIGKGLGIDYFHCQTCNVCMAIGLKGRHKCIERNLESDCPICGEYMFTSTSTVIFMPCGHCMHHKCHQQYIQTSYQCPTCLKALADMTEYYQRIDAALLQHRMPSEYDGTFSHIYCNDCEKRSHAKFHFLYHKCAHCLGYNTKVLSTLQSLPPDALMAPPLENMDRPPLEPAGSSSSLISESPSVNESISSSSSSVASGFWCHQCQLPTETIIDSGITKCRQCRSEFVEHL